MLRVTIFSVQCWLSTLNLQQLRIFVATARSGHLSKAAERLFLSQPAASAQIKGIEQELELALFTRHHSGLELTEAGRKLLPRAENLLLDVDAFKAQARTLTGRISGKLRIGSASDPERVRMGGVLSEFVLQHPLIQVSVQQRSSASCYAGLCTGELDACFALQLAVDDSVTVRHLREVNYVVCAGKSFESDISDWSLAESAAAPWILPPIGGAHDRMLQELFSNHRLDLNPAARVDNEHLTRHCVVKGVGLGLLNQEQAELDVKSGLISVAKDQRVTTRLSFAHLSQRRGDPIIGALLETVESVWNPGRNPLSSTESALSELASGLSI
ncbi:LysR family transcriptional regulator [Ottowia thiooxydans]|uniref:LysR family transcriptional regulator n=1 Tax=Ottowia thiooxydans TaxID=219182 RepID=UPI002480A3AE|nr:LysR family transcriptional regulator [Ottowia thiooxydans]